MVSGCVDSKSILEAANGCAKESSDDLERSERLADGLRKYNEVLAADRSVRANTDAVASSYRASPGHPRRDTMRQAREGLMYAAKSGGHHFNCPVTFSAKVKFEWSNAPGD